MTKLTDAQKISQKKYDEKFPTLCVRLDRETYDWVKNYSKDNNIADKNTIKMAIEQLKVEMNLLKGKEKKGLKESLKGLFSK
jgi:hypothetical protein